MFVCENRKQDEMAEDYDEKINIFYSHCIDKIN